MRPLTTSRPFAAVLGVLLLALPMPSVVSAAEEPDPASAQALLTPFALVDDRDVEDRLVLAEDRYAPAGGCYLLEVDGTGWIGRDGSGLAVTGAMAEALPLHFQPTRLGEYLLATDEGPSDDVPEAWWDDRGYVGAVPVAPAEVTGGGDVLTDAVLPGLPDEPGPVTDQVGIAASPGAAAEWRLRAAGDDPERRADDQTFVLDLPAVDKALDVVDDGVVLVDGDVGSVGFRLHLAVSDDCAVWPEVDTNTSGPPTAPGGGAAGAVEGFFESHVHGMAYEFLGGRARCGQPWHPYGVEFALPNCQEDGEPINPVTELALASTDPSSYDPVGWPTFGYWPQHDALTHEQYYWRWLERAYHAGLRLTTNLFVDNTALCQVFPQKKNSCNEMDGVRLQARRIFELQDYIDAQSGGPGEGWYRIVTTPSEARRVINAGRLAVVLGVEVSVLLDCGEIMTVPQCVPEDLTTRLQEVYDMGVRQMELINKFDNGFAGVTGDGGTTGVVVNQGNRLVTGHYWDMRTCPETADDGHVHPEFGLLEGEQHDKLQNNLSDDVGGGSTPEEIDVLAGTIIDVFGPVTSAAAPAYPAGPHCNAAGLTDLGRQLVTEMARKGMVIDPDHMSASAQTGLLDLVSDELVPAERAAAAAEQRPVRLPALISSHSWGNDVIYQRIHAEGGQVAPRTSDAGRFADRWARNRSWSERLAPDDVLFGMGFGADTNGFGAQPGPWSDATTPFTYPDAGWTSVIGDVTIRQQTSGVRTFDIASEGVAHYGIFADWFREVALAADERFPDLGGGDAILRDLLHGPENYLQMWERAVYGGNECVTDGAFFQPEDLHALIGANLEGFLTAIGQPVDRDGSVYTYCLEGEGGRITPFDVTFDDNGTATGVTPNPGTVTPVAAPPTDPEAAPHTHDTGMPATGRGGLLPLALLLLGLVGLLHDRRR